MTFQCSASAAVVQFDKEASRTRDYWVAKNVTLRAARPDPSPRKERLLRMTIKLHHYDRAREIPLRDTIAFSCQTI